MVLGISGVVWSVRLVHTRFSCPFGLWVGLATFGIYLDVLISSLFFSANFIESFFLLAGSISSFRSLHPFSYSLPVIVATAFLWTLERERDCLLVIAPVHTGQFASRWTLPSLFQKSARVVLSTPSCFILLSLQMVFEAFFVMFSIWASHFRSFCNITPRIFKTGFTSRTSVPTWNSGGNACFLEKKY